MRIYYIFLIKKEILKNAKTNPYNLYKILESIYLMNNEKFVIGYKAFNKICEIINKNNYNKLIKDLNIDNLNYTIYDNVHVINDFFRNENTKLIINNTHMKLKSNVYYPSFLSDIQNVSNAFVCDFINMDYFFLQDILIKNS